jgi:hypothetical protein
VIRHQQVERGAHRRRPRIETGSQPQIGPQHADEDRDQRGGEQLVADAQPGGCEDTSDKKSEGWIEKEHRSAAHILSQVGKPARIEFAAGQLLVKRCLPGKVIALVMSSGKTADEIREDRQEGQRQKQ